MSIGSAEIRADVDHRSVIVNRTNLRRVSLSFEFGKSN